jgi:hypothetical protein
VKAKVTGYDFPSSCMASTEVSFKISGHLEEQDSPCLGFIYSSGPADFIVVDTYWKSKVVVGQPAAVVYHGYPVCTALGFSSPAYKLVFPVEGVYTLGVFAGYWTGSAVVVEDGPYNVSVQVTPFTPAKVSIVGYDVPKEAYVGSAADFHVDGHVDVAGGCPCVGLMYVDGPSATIKVKGSDVSKGSACVAAYTVVKDACTSLKLEGQVVFPSVGRYKVAVLAGSLDILKGTMYVDVRVDVDVNVVEAAPQTANISGKVVESFLFGLIKRPSTGAVVSLDSLMSTQSQAGMYSLTDVPLGSYKVSVSKNWFERKEQNITLSEAGKTYTLDFEIGISKWVNYGVVAGAFVVPLLALVLAKR